MLEASYVNPNQGALPLQRTLSKRKLLIFASDAG